MRIYIASSWRNQHAVEMLTDLLEVRGCHTVDSFVRQASSYEPGSKVGFDLDAWLETEDANDKFKFDTRSAMLNDLVIYISPSGTDAWAEVGAAWASQVKVLGLYAKGEPAGLMRKMVKWFTSYKELLSHIQEIDDNG